MAREPEGRAHEGAWVRRLARWGATTAPDPVLALAPLVVGALFAAALPVTRARVIATQRRVLGRRGALREHVDAGRTITEFAHSFAEGLALSARGGRGLTCTTQGQEAFRRVLAEGRGAVLVTAHTGAWEVTAPRLVEDLHVPVLAVMEPEADAGGRRVQDASRRAAGIGVTHVDGGVTAGLAALAHVRAGGLVAFQVDRAPVGTRSLPVTAFGVPARLPLGPFVLAAVSGAPLVTAFSLRTGFLAYRVELAPPLTVTRGEEGRAAAVVALALEAFVREHPRAWMTFGAEAESLFGAARTSRSPRGRARPG